MQLAFSNPRFLLAFGTALFLLASCSSAKMAPGELDRVKNLAPPAGKALLYVVRPSALGGAIAFATRCDGVVLGSTTGKRFIYAYLEPEVRHLSAKAENEAEISLEVEAAKTYSSKCNPKWGFYGPLELEKTRLGRGQVEAP